ncbi:CRISPR-associated Cas3 family helicase [Plasticicumulans lactativorans]|uniref:CRISPR-associated Cas3 family helicase n=1 Tax=Plasticicumulans lactativorans TaxID=1133106 RepID=A0A4R2LC87_9GAMM|nr:CRISPR-associated helicase/endonuclease Cas3 [Plasticicumulans lactativorans]TCO82055.1 CRISPR-associated Cas3 family helicase [Plasticicumulans lactativorans]
MYASYWGKARRPEDAPTDAAGWHPFALHSLDVVAVADAWLAASATLRRAFGSDDPRHAAWLRFFIALHDLGKLDVRFQSKAPEVLKALGRYPAREVSHIDGRHYAHGPEGYAQGLGELPRWLGSREPDEFIDVVDGWQPWLAAVTGHHGAIPYERQPMAHRLVLLPIRELDRAARAAWVRCCADAFLQPAGCALDTVPPPAPPLLAGFCAICDWLGSNTDYFGYRTDAPPVAAYLDERADAAARALRDSGLCRPALRVGGMAAVFPARVPRQVQRLVDELPVAPGLTLVEAPTGSGKTEAALAYAAHLLAAGCAEAIVFALPTQATANAMLARLEAVAPKLFPGTDANVVLAHGKARYNPDFIELRRAAHARTAQRDEEALVQCAGWLAQSRKRALLGQIGVCTVDQVLLAVLPVKHAFVRTLGIGRSVLIVDEVHAYDRYMYGLLEAVLAAQHAAGGSAVLLSATLPRVQRARLVGAWRAGLTLPEAADGRYPLLTHVPAAGALRLLPDSDAATAPEPAGYGPSPRTVAVRCIEAPAAAPTDAVLDELLAKARAGGRVAVICNLVDAAQQLARALRARAPDVAVDLFHARYRFRDRQARERRILAVYGPQAACGSGRILVATQVVEQSLDLCFDWLVTQLCPIDLLFQRLGRLHRHPRSYAPGCTTTACTVLLPTEADFGVHRRIYGDARVLWRTAQRLRGCDGAIHFPLAYRGWIEDVYDEDDHDEPAAITALADAFRDAQCRLAQKAKRLTRERMNPLADRDQQVRALTRAEADALPVLPLAAAGRLLDGRAIADIGEWERDEAIDQALVQVPRSWADWLPAADAEGRIELSMQPDGADAWLTDGPKGRLRYSVEYGMEKEAQ